MFFRNIKFSFSQTKCFLIIFKTNFSDFTSIIDNDHIDIIGRRLTFAFAPRAKRERRVVRIVAVGKEFFGDLWRETRELSLSPSLPLSFPHSDFDVSQIYRGASASAARRYEGNENLRKGIYPTCRNISSARSLTLYSDLFYAGESGSARLQFRKVSRLPRVVCTPRVRDFDNLRESSSSSARPSFSGPQSDHRPADERALFQKEISSFL